MTTIALRRTGTAEALRRDLALAAVAVLVLLAAWECILLAGVLQPGSAGVDLHLYRGAAQSWLAGDGFYHARQLAGPYEIMGGSLTYAGDVLYPPTILWLLVPFTVLPDWLWYAIPAAMVGWGIWLSRPPVWTWPLIVLPLAYPIDLGTIIAGNPVLWCVGLTWLGIVYGWGGAFVWLKPSLFPFALLGIRSRGWWIACAALVLLTLPFLPLTFDYVRVLLDSRGGGLLYSLPHAPLFLGPAAVAWSRRQTIEP